MSHVDSESHLLNHYRMSYRGYFLNTLSPHDRREASADTDRSFDFTTIRTDYTPDAKQNQGENSGFPRTNLAVPAAWSYPGNLV
ncbi:MAG: hypothetical protein J7M40_16085 [Planctomycetes bacterium]|nr:hypothetical protein [Planctomycetota bacterium]